MRGHKAFVGRYGQALGGAVPGRHGEYPGLLRRIEDGLAEHGLSFCHRAHEGGAVRGGLNEAGGGRGEGLREAGAWGQEGQSQGEASAY